LGSLEEAIVVHAKYNSDFHWSIVDRDLRLLTTLGVFCKLLACISPVILVEKL
jgi:hypothetical protein